MLSNRNALFAFERIISRWPTQVEALTQARVCVYVHELYLDLNQQMEDITEGQRAC